MLLFADANDDDDVKRQAHGIAIQKVSPENCINFVYLPQLFSIFLHRQFSVIVFFPFHPPSSEHKANEIRSTWQREGTGKKINSK